MKADVAVIGSGPAGMTAALHASRAGAQKVMLLEREEELGGILKQCIHNGFGLEQFKKDYTGPEYAERLINEVERANVTCLLNTMVTGLSAGRKITAVNPERGVFTIDAKSVVLAMGCRERTRGNIDIAGTRPAGVYTAGVAQRFVNIDGYLPGKRFVILGSGDIGLIMARRLVLEGASVEGVYEIMPHPNGLRRNIVQCLHDFDIPLHLRHTVVEVRGDERVEGVAVAKVDDDLRPLPGTERFVECDTLLASVGLIPENELSKAAGVELSEATGGPICTESMETSVEGIFSCGNVATVFDVVDYVARTGERAGVNASLHANGETMATVRTVDVVSGQNVAMVFPQRYSFGEDLELFIRAQTPVEKKVKVAVSPMGLRFSKPYARPNEMTRVRIAREKLSDVLGPIEVSIVE